MHILPQRIRESEGANNIAWVVVIIFIAILILIFIITLKSVWEDASYDDITGEFNQCIISESARSKEIFSMKLENQESLNKFLSSLNENREEFSNCFDRATKGQNIYIEK